MLEKAGIPRSALNVSGRAALTETDVAVAVADGGADWGLAIGAVARRFGLDFVPLHRERFDLALSRRVYFEPELQRLFALPEPRRFASAPTRSATTT